MVALDPWGNQVRAKHILTVAVTLQSSHIMTTVRLHYISIPVVECLLKYVLKRKIYRIGSSEFGDYHCADVTIEPPKLNSRPVYIFILWLTSLNSAFTVGEVY